MADYLRKVEPEDRELLFLWANDPECRKNAFRTEPISLEEHIKWFQKKIDSTETFLYIYMVEQQAVGQVRVELDEKEGVIDYFIQKESRGHGYGVQMLKRLEEKMKCTHKVERLAAYVKSDNMPSNHVFRRLSYEEEKKENIFIYRKAVN